MEVGVGSGIINIAMIDSCVTSCVRLSLKALLMQPTNHLLGFKAYKMPTLPSENSH